MTQKNTKHYICVVTNGCGHIDLTLKNVHFEVVCAELLFLPYWDCRILEKMLLPARCTYTFYSENIHMQKCPFPVQDFALLLITVKSILWTYTRNNCARFFVLTVFFFHLLVLLYLPEKALNLEMVL